MQDQELLIQLINELKPHYELVLYTVAYDNFELEITNKDINPGEMTIDFQKQNSSFILVTKKDIDQLVRKDMMGKIESTTNIDLFAEYAFCDSPDYQISHWCYDEEEKNERILLEFQKLKKLSHLDFKRKKYSRR